MTFRRLRNGDPLRIRAKDWNNLGNLLEKSSGNVFPEKQMSSNARTYVSVINNEAAVADTGSVWAIGEAVIRPEENMGEYLSKPLFALKQASPEATEALCVMLRPLNSKEVGIAAVTGIVPVNCLISDKEAIRARPDGKGGLISDNTGQIQLVYVPGTGIQKCFALLGGGGSGQTNDNGAFDLYLENKQDGENVKTFVVCRNTILPDSSTEAGIVMLGNNRITVNAMIVEAAEGVVYLDVNAMPVAAAGGSVRYELSGEVILKKQMPDVLPDERRYVLRIGQIAKSQGQWKAYRTRNTGDVEILGRWS